jgi:hypothetical protein
MKYLKLYEEFNDVNITKEPITTDRVSMFDENVFKLLPPKLTVVSSTGTWTLTKSEFTLNNVKAEILYNQNTVELDDEGDVTADGEPDTLEFDIHIVKNNDGTDANPDTLKLNVDMTYGDSMVSEFTIEGPNKVEPHHYTGANSMYDPNSAFGFDDESLQALVEFFNRFSDNYKLTTDDFKFLDSDPNSYKPYY